MLSSNGIIRISSNQSVGCEEGVEAVETVEIVEGDYWQKTKRLLNLNISTIQHFNKSYGLRSSAIGSQK